MMIDEILPRAAACVEAFGDLPGATLPPEEAALIAGAVAKRRDEFTTARHCARQALAALGLPPVAIPADQRRAPRWPAGVTGTITHCTGYRAAAVARVTDLAALGADAEPDDALPEGVLRTIALPEEIGHLDELSRTAPGAHWDRLLFCAKEAVYKAWYPLTGRWLGFEDARITMVATDAATADPDPAEGRSGTFAACLVPPAAARDGRRLAGFDGRWLVRGGLVLAAVAVPP